MFTCACFLNDWSASVLACAPIEPCNKKKAEFLPPANDSNYFQQLKSKSQTKLNAARVKGGRKAERGARADIASAFDFGD